MSLSENTRKQERYTHISYPNNSVIWNEITTTEGPRNARVAAIADFKEWLLVQREMERNRCFCFLLIWKLLENRKQTNNNNKTHEISCFTCFMTLKKPSYASTSSSSRARQTPHGSLNSMFVFFCLGSPV